ncbi:MAG TPA: carboxymuconolactone decarboxylase family protein [Cyclobacteriaceae bacterium]
MSTQTVEKIINLELLEKDQAPEKSKTILEKTEKSMGMIPNMYKGFANSPALFQAYAESYRAFREDTGFTPPEQETVFLTVSVVNDCHYCKSAHTFLAKNVSKLSEDVYNAILNSSSIPDTKLAALSKLTKTIVEKKGWLDRSDIEEFTAAGYSEKNVMDVIAGVGTKLFSNYMNHIFQTPIDDMFKG